MLLANYPILVYPSQAEAQHGVAVIEAIGEAYHVSLGYIIADNPRRIVPKSLATGQDRPDAAGRLGWYGPYFYGGLHYTLSPTPEFGEGWKDRYSLANGPAYVEQLSPAEWFDSDGVPV